MPEASAPSSGKKANAFTGHWSREETVQGENKASEKSKSKPDQQSLKKRKAATDSSPDVC